MSIDYDQLREMVRVVEDRTGYDPVEVYTAGDELEDLAPDMARELLRLRDEIKALRNICTRAATVCRSANDPEAPALASNLESVARSLTVLLEGDTE